MKLLRTLAVYSLITGSFLMVGAQETNAKTPPNAVNAVANPPAIQIIPSLPVDIPNGAAQASLAEAAAFAWQEFIALNWPAGPQQGQAGQRGTPNYGKRFGEPGYTGPLVWETYRSKAELYPGANHDPNGYDPNVPDNGYDALPQYNYGDSVSPCVNQSPVNSPAWVNLDEITQIGLNSIFSGKLDGVSAGTNSQPSLIRFLAKANREYYKYITGTNVGGSSPPPSDNRKYWNHGGDYYTRVNTFTNSIRNPNGVPPATDTIISFPNGTVMVKAAWRMAAPGDDLSQFHTATVRYYENADPGHLNGPNGVPCYYEDQTWVLLALHIVHKTPSAPYFTFATFEQTDNIVTATGQSTENVDGIPTNPGLFATPYDPMLNYQDGYQAGQGPTPMVTTEGPFVTDFGKRTYYKNLALGSPKDPSGNGGIALQTRAISIPLPIIHTNTAAHNAIQAYNGANGIGQSPWQFYKLVNIQYQPFNQSDISSNPADDKNAATYYQANSVVESNYSLAHFRGAQVGLGSPYQGNTTNFGPDGTTPVINTFVPNGSSYLRYNMGGCMGCHGVAQKQGADFSFMLNFGSTMRPEFPEATEKMVEHYQLPFGN